MERLTERIEKYIEAYQLPPFGREVDGTVELLQEVLKKLAYYEDAEEQDLLLWLPVAPNTTVYEVCNNTDACCECEYFEKGYCCPDYCNNKDVRNEDGEIYLSFPQFADKPLCEKHYLMVHPVKITLEMILRNRDNFGITIFKTQEEAEQKLKEMEYK